MEIKYPHSSNLKCPTCQIDILNEDQYKAHYKAEFHRYNLKRKMIKLPAATYQQFLSKKTNSDQQKDIQSFICNQCGKKFNSDKTFNQHITSKKHNPNLIKERVQKIKAEAFKKDQLLCLFCLFKSTTFSQNLTHMQIKHSFFIGSQQYCTNEKQLILYLQQKIQIGFMCIYCQNKKAKDFNSGDAVRKHMIDKGHCFMKIQDGYQEYQKYYDFSILFRQKLKQQNKIVPGISFQEIQVIYKNQGEIKDNDKQQEDWVDQDQEDQDQGQWQSDDDDNQGQEVIQQSQNIPKTKKYMIMRPTLTSNDQLLLPNGKILGHRKYKYLYKQTYRPSYYRQRDLKMLQTFAHSTTISTKQQLFQLKKTQRLLKKRNILHKKHYLKVGITNNTQMHYRCQNSL